MHISVLPKDPRPSGWYAISPEPPLLLGVDWPVLLLGFVVYAALAAVVVGIATRRAFRGDVAGRFAEVGT